MTRVLVVDDSRFMRTVVGNALEEAGVAVETAADGETAVDAVAEYDPDVVTMDVEMPGMSGIEAVERIMATNPTAILMVSAHTERGAAATLDALERGAVDFIHKPDGSGSRNVAHLSETLVETVESIADADVSSLALARAAAAAHSTSENRLEAPGSTGPTADDRPASTTEAATPDGAVDDEARLDDPTVVVGASTGGPKIVERIVAALPTGLAASVLLVQHMPADFTHRFADRLDEISDYHIREAADGDRVGAAEAVVAPGGSHLVVTDETDGTVGVELDDGDRIHGVRPSIDVTMRTAASTVDGPLVGVVLTGMGRDGAAGIEAIKDAGGRTIAQDETTSPVFGIPRKAIETGCVDAVLPTRSVADGIVDAVEAAGTGGEIHG